MTAGTGHSSLIQGIGVCAMTRNAIAVVQGTVGAADGGNARRCGKNQRDLTCATQFRSSPRQCAYLAVRRRAPAFIAGIRMEPSVLPLRQTGAWNRAAKCLRVPARTVPVK